MPLDPGIQGHEYEPLKVTYDERDTILYALGVGAGVRDDELDLVFEPRLKALPTFPVVLPFPLIMRMEEELGIAQELMLHGEQRLQLHRSPPPTGTAEITAHVADVWDKGTGAIVDTAAAIRVDGQPVATTTYSTFIRGGGGFGGERGAGLAKPEISGEPLATASERTLPQQAKIYRLSGDANPLHLDPGFAQRAQLDRPILHGLCTYGFATRLAMHLVADGDPARVTGVDARFTGMVYPGDELKIELWPAGQPERIYAKVSVPERDVTVIDPLLILLAG
jgi:acyl dehydratase